ncbi:hypothetical protein U91I_00573 [alpha proteobacterium U9-1i]|nr:hypothetical protein U91I_00573 [alpha proteobacterium U9-1i]
MATIEAATTVTTQKVRMRGTLMGILHSFAGDLPTESAQAGPRGNGVAAWEFSAAQEVQSLQVAST